MVSWMSTARPSNYCWALPWVQHLLHWNHCVLWYVTSGCTILLSQLSSPAASRTIFVASFLLGWLITNSDGLASYPIISLLVYWPPNHGDGAQYFKAMAKIFLDFGA